MCVLTNLCVNENLVYSHAVTAAFCPSALDVCTQKTIYQKFKLIWFKTHDFSAINMIIRTKTDVFSRYELKWRSSILERGRSSSSFGFKETGTNMNEWCIYIALLLCIAIHPKRFTIMWRGGGLSSTTTSVQHPLGWCDGSHSTTAPVRSPHTSYRWRGERDRANQVDGDY